ncbi:MAG: UDP-2,3-diacylglucosamine diphosphatase LpxI [Synergistetes bacterium]|nr:UDP-2,3-diacylglucosamine diphosphatase LpxI [Synergistota bacterium]MDW8193114.1 UDP-2,3-diacylglucosamine diphosphatase LpxI [Synergistota bacterium]
MFEGTDVIGLIAGEGRLPLFIYERLQPKPVVVGLGDVDRSLKVDLLMQNADIEGVISFLKGRGVKLVFLAGKVPKTWIFDPSKLTSKSLAFLSSLKDKSDHEVLGRLVELFEREGFKIGDYRTLVKDMLAPQGSFGSREPTPEEWRDISYGFNIAKRMAAMSFGQTVVLKKGAVLAVEAIEGTDEAIKRGARYGGEGIVVVKVIKEGQDPRYDLPTIGADTLKLLRDVKASCLAVEAGMTVILDKEEVLRIASEGNIALVGVSS